jgi:hypothetical protein
MPQIYDMGTPALLPLRRKACWGFFAPKNPTASAGFESANLGTRGQHTSSRPPKPLVIVCYFKYLINLIVLETYSHAYQDSIVIIDHEWNNPWYVLLLIINNSSCRFRLGDAWPFVIDYERKVYRYWLRQRLLIDYKLKMCDTLRYGSHRISRHWSHGSCGYWSRDNSCRWSRL